jgi:lipopolysaccharide/colanic/teichoic acid biosynthesis glycosyltransferase
MIAKYLFDRIMAFVGLVVLSPILFVVWILIRIKMPDGPAVFTQKRVGKGGRLFTIAIIILCQCLERLTC